MTRLGVAIIGFNGAVSTTMIAGIQMMKRGLVARQGMLTESGGAQGRSPLAGLLTFPKLEEMVFGGWDIHAGNLHDAALHHGVFHPAQLEAVRDDLQRLHPWPAVFEKPYAVNLDGDYLVTSSSQRDHVDAVRADLQRFQHEEKLDRLVLVNLASTESWIDREPVHETLPAFERGLDHDDPAISPMMRYFYAANSLGIPHVNFAPSLANIPALASQAEQCGVPYAGMDGKTGQTLVKTALASMFRARRLEVAGWYSINFLGNNDGLVLDAPASNKTKIVSKSSVLDSVVGHEVKNHQVHIHYYKPRGDAKEAWDNIDIVGYAGVPMQMKINFLCQDSILAAPLVVDLVRLVDAAKTRGQRGIQRQLSMFFKSPYHAPGEQPIHDFFVQEKLLLDWAQSAGALAKGNGKAAANINGDSAAAEAEEGRRSDRQVIPARGVA